MKTVDISGMGGEYEWACQMMIRAGLDCIDLIGVPSADEFKEGSESVRAGQIKTAMRSALGDEGPSGAMFGAALTHVYKRASMGEKAYFDVFKDEQDRIYNFDPSNKNQREMDK